MVRQLVAQQCVRRVLRTPNSEANEQVTTPWVVVVELVVVLENKRLSASDCSAQEDEAGSDRVDGGGEGGTIGREDKGGDGGVPGVALPLHSRMPVADVGQRWTE